MEPSFNLSESLTRAIAEAVRVEVGAAMQTLLAQTTTMRLPSVDRPVFLSVNQVLDLLRVSRTELYRLFKRKELTPVKRGRSTLVHRDDLDRYIARLRGDTGAASTAA
jgi:excisionase family DNA binding protein